MLIDSSLIDGAPRYRGDRFAGGPTFARNVYTSGYGMAVGKNGKPLVADAKIDEYVSGGVFALDEPCQDDR